MKNLLTDILNNVETKNLPKIEINNKLILFTNTVLNDGATGNDVFIVWHNNKLIGLEYGYEPDCDGSYTWTKYIKLNKSFDLGRYSINSDFYFNKSSFYDLIYQLHSCIKY